MKRIGTLNFALALSLMVPLAVSAQQETNQTREATKLIALAMTRDTHQERAELYRDAMTHLTPAMQEDADNARVWLLSGTAMAGLGQMQEADEAFDRAVALHADFADDVESERFDAWIRSFERGVEAMDAEQYDAALAAMEGAELMYTGRPEALMYLGILYANHTMEYDKAIVAFEGALEATQGPLFETLDEAGQAEWESMRPGLRENIEQMHMANAVTAFQNGDFRAAIEAFRTLTDSNPYSRDAWFNYGQALLARAQEIGDTVEEMEPAEAAAAKEELMPILDELDRVAQKALEADPNSMLLHQVLANAHRMRGEFTGTEESLAAGQAGALAALEALDALPVMIDAIQVVPGEENAQVTGTLTNHRMDPGAPVQINITLLDRDGQSVGQQTITVNAPEAEVQVPFEATITPTGIIAGWRYTVGS